MRKAILAVALLGASGSAQAVTYTGEIRGTVASRFATDFTAPDAVADIAVGDIITATFSFAHDDGTDAGSLSGALGRSLAALTNQASFDLAGHRWTSRGDFLAGLVVPKFGTPEDPFAPLSLTMDDAPGAGDLAVRGYGFEINDFGYDLYRGFGYAGTFDRSTLTIRAGDQSKASALAAPVPEAATWALMIAGFGLAGAALRSRRTSLSWA